MSSFLCSTMMCTLTLALCFLCVWVRLRRFRHSRVYTWVQLLHIVFSSFDKASTYVGWGRECDGLDKRSALLACQLSCVRLPNSSSRFILLKTTRNHGLIFIPYLTINLTAWNTYEWKDKDKKWIQLTTITHFHYQACEIGSTLALHTLPQSHHQSSPTRGATLHLEHH